MESGVKGILDGVSVGKSVLFMGKLKSDSIKAEELESKIWCAIFITSHTSSDAWITFCSKMHFSKEVSSLELAVFRLLT